MNTVKEQTKFAQQDPWSIQESPPLDRFEAHTLTVEQWLANTMEHKVRNEKWRMLIHACSLIEPYVAIAGLRQDPRVSYDPGQDSPVFIFKVRHNGATYLVARNRVLLPEAVEIGRRPTLQTTPTHDNTELQELQGKILSFLMTEYARKDNCQLTGIDLLLYARGTGFKDEEIRTWRDTDEPELFAESVKFVRVEQLVAQIIKIAEGIADTKAPGKHRFIVRTQRRLGGRAVHSFVIP